MYFHAAYEYNRSYAYKPTRKRNTKKRALTRANWDRFGKGQNFVQNLTVISVGTAACSQLCSRVEALAMNSKSKKAEDASQAFLGRPVHRV
eukprot:g44168.t1